MQDRLSPVFVVHDCTYSASLLNGYSFGEWKHLDNMNTKKIITIGFELATDDTHYSSLQSTPSLLDWDIALFRPVLGDFYSHGDYYQGKPSLSDSSSFRVKECYAHWRREIKQAVETGKTVIVYLPALEEVFVDTGNRSYSGTGRNRQTTRLVELFTNYEAIPADLSPISATGTSMKLVDKGAEFLAPYWADFESYSEFQVLLTVPTNSPCLTTRTGAKTVGAIFRSTVSPGTMLLLPDIDFYDEQFLSEEGEETQWNDVAEKFSRNLVSSIVALDKALRSSSEVTPEPAWATTPEYSLSAEEDLRRKLLEAENNVERAQREKEELINELTTMGQFRGLLYEKGKPLENAIIKSLHILGFTAAPFKNASSEFDVVFECKEGRFIGEAEGKDTKAINIDKLRQLSMNIHEDLQREEVTTPAKPVLFGNAFRLRPVSERPDPFTEKCHSATESSSTALVHTPDLFNVVKYLLDCPDDGYAQACRNAIFNSNGRVIFPVPPESAFSPSAENTNPID
ncbi:hypothetical protein L518_0227 [Bordetella bronchiseptica MBORD675]|nr:hypothetical protein L518_0227 [Bordetella bronchiseptica MBORD675]